jgi:peptidoglycan/xylan/chitin deacetylase (PgdA/CDA1 family)
VHITFDDGWDGTFTHALPVLQKYDLEATLFVTTNLLGKPGFMKAEDLKNLPTNLKIGSHAHTHTMLDELSYREVEEELKLSKKILEDLTGSEVNTFAFPGGSFMNDHIKIAHDVGYKLIFNSMIGINHKLNPSFIKRVPIYDWTSIPTFMRFLNHQIMPEFVRQQALSIPKKLLKKQHYLKLREFFLGEKHD